MEETLSDERRREIETRIAELKAKAAETQGQKNTPAIEPFEDSDTLIARATERAKANEDIAKELDRKAAEEKASMETTAEMATPEPETLEPEKVAPPQTTQEPTPPIETSEEKPIPAKATPEINTEEPQETLKHKDEDIHRQINLLLKESMENRTLSDLESMEREARFLLEAHPNVNDSSTLNDFIDEVEEIIKKHSETLALKAHKEGEARLLSGLREGIEEGLLGPHTTTDDTDPEELKYERERRKQVKAVNEVQKVIWDRYANPIKTEKGTVYIKIKGVAPRLLKKTREHLQTALDGGKGPETPERLREVIGLINQELSLEAEKKILASIERKLKRIDDTKKLKTYQERDLRAYRAWVEAQLRYPAAETRADLKSRLEAHLATVNERLADIEKKKTPIVKLEPVTADTATKAPAWTPEKEARYQKLKQIIADASRRLAINGEKLQRIIDAREARAREAAKPKKEEIEIFDTNFLQIKIREILASFDAVKTINSLSVVGSGDSLVFNSKITAKKFFVTTEVTLKDAKIVNAGDSVKVDTYQVTATTAKDMVKGIIDENIGSVGKKLKEFIEREKGKKVQKISIANGQLKVEYEKK